jgi:hypothetical protein
MKRSPTSEPRSRSVLVLPSAAIERAVCTENPIRVDGLMESPKAGGMIRLLCFALAVLASPFKLKLRLEAEMPVRLVHVALTLALQESKR